MAAFVLTCPTFSVDRAVASHSVASSSCLTSAKKSFYGNRESLKGVSFDVSDIGRELQFVSIAPTSMVQGPRPSTGRVSSKELTPENIDYKNIDLLRNFVSPDTGKIMPRKTTRLSARQQRHIARAIKRARIMSLLPFPDC